VWVGEGEGVAVISIPHTHTLALISCLLTSKILPVSLNIRSLAVAIGFKNVLKTPLVQFLFLIFSFFSLTSTHVNNN